ncbi:Hypothetical protein, putative [Bodo saltans]|uniref:Uncharacterized protein n=1 Tax=Bodo saltans TaxID=75058 RepID=A0A0S4IJM3_BODSA|nr:Hypothetical protein, putative [Bodo saltans]|eukprot:CUE56173.1 Hypothetical protein, putative [Bodo saltans]
MLSDSWRRSSMALRSSSNALRCHTLSLRTCELLLWLLISLTFKSRHFSPFLVSAQSTMSSPGSYNASCQNVTIQAFGGPVIVYDPGASVRLVWNAYTCQNQYITTRSVTLIGGSLCGNASVTITTDSYYIYGKYPDSYCGRSYPSQLTIDFRNSERSVVFSTSQIESGTTTTITLGGGRLSFAVPSFTIVGTMNVLFTTQNNNSSLVANE